MKAGVGMASNQYNNISSLYNLSTEKINEVVIDVRSILEDIQLTIATLEKLKKEKEALLQDKEVGYIEEPPKQGDKNNIVLPIIFVILSVGTMIFSLYIREEGDSYVTSGISLGVNLIIFIYQGLRLILNWFRNWMLLMRELI